MPIIQIRGKVVVKLDYFGFITMVQKLLLSLLLFLFASPMALHITAYAHSGANTSEEEKESDEFRISLFPEDTYEITFFHEPQISESKFTMRLHYKGVVAGCAHMDDITSEEEQEKYNFKNGISTKITNGTLKVLISQPVINDSDENPRYTSYDCDIKHNESYVDLEVDRDMLIRKKIKKMGFKNIKTADFGNFEIDVNKDRFIIKTPTEHGETWQTLWFFPKNTIMLIAPRAKADVNVLEQLKDFGVKRGLTPMEDVLDGYNLPNTANNYMFFVDKKAKIVSKLTPEHNNYNIGKITATKTYYGPKGAREEPYTLDVMAKLPLIHKIKED